MLPSLTDNIMARIASAFRRYSWLKDTGIVLFILFIAAIVVGWLVAIPTWVLTHHLHHSHFTLIMGWITYATLTITIVIILFAMADEHS